jgi:ankyrin repeat protein
MSDFYRAVENNNLAEVRRILLRDINLEERDINGRTPLLLAITEDNYELFMLLLTLGANPSGPSEGDKPVILWAMESFPEDPRFAEELVRRGADVNYTDYVGFPSIAGELSEHGDMNSIRFLVNHGADINARVRAIIHESWNEAYKADLRDADNKTALYLAVKTNNVEAVRLLLEHRAQIDPEVHDKARELGNREILSLLSHDRRRHALTTLRTRRGGRRSRRVKRRS